MNDTRAPKVGDKIILRCPCHDGKLAEIIDVTDAEAEAVRVKTADGKEWLAAFPRRWWAFADEQEAADG